ncbi:adenylosuccinate lyase, partial [Candidatus Bipolaricaulota bacterium]|nr:adenylosuccinate lyase [Candidatus Bipolaricaulota bacterium]
MIDRYGLSPMRELWRLESQYEHWLKVELAALAAMEEVGEVPAGTYAAVKNHVHVDVKRSLEIESEIRHDLLAFIRSLEQQAGDVGRFIHRGLTSSDVKDTALSLQMRAGLSLILD